MPEQVSPQRQMLTFLQTPPAQSASDQHPPWGGASLHTPAVQRCEALRHGALSLQQP
jgi:hypothetical protein